MSKRNLSGFSYFFMDYSFFKKLAFVVMLARASETEFEFNEVFFEVGV